MEKSDLTDKAPKQFLFILKFKRYKFIFASMFMIKKVD